MKDDHLKSISDDFDSLRNKNDFVNLLNRVHKILSEDNSSKDPFKLSTINFYAFHHKNSYFVFDVLKKNGTARKIRAPHPYLKIIQQCVNFILASKFNSHHTSHGFLLGKSILTNARTHVGKGYVLNVDIKDFFHTISFRRVKTVLGMHPFNLSGEREEIAFILSNLCCNRGVLPQGAPSSPILTNIVCQRLDRKLFQLAKNWKVRYSRYADDISFSCNEDVFKEKFLEELESIIKYEGFDLNPSKTRIQNWKQRQEVTGIIVNRKINVNREYIRSIRAIICNYEKRGLEFTQQVFLKHWSKHGKSAPSFIESLKGRIEYLGMVRGKKDGIYLYYKRQYLRLFSNDFIDYSFINNTSVRTQLELDYKKMDLCRQNGLLSEEEKFAEYSLYAFFQIEELINYYLTTSMSMDQLKTELISHTLLTPKNLKNKSDVSEVPIVFKVFLFEKYFYYKARGFYDSNITKLRIIRNQMLHRQSATKRKESDIINEYILLQEKIKNHEANEYKLSFQERHLENEYKALNFYKERNYATVLHTIKDVMEKVKTATTNRNRV